MMSNVAGAFIWAVIAGTAIAAILTLLVAAIVSSQRPAASVRGALWFVALATYLLAPLTITSVMAVRGADVRLPISGIDTALRRTSSSAQRFHPRFHALVSAARSLAKQPVVPANLALRAGAIWGAGALAGLIGLARSVARVRGLKARSSPLDGALADELPWLTQRPGREIYLRLSYEIETPIAVGFRRPVILMPTEMATAAGLTAIEPLVMHEYAHLANFDDWTNLVQRGIERLLWFNPLVWYVGRRIALEREVAADEAVVHRTRAATEYASTLWRMAREMRMPENVVVAPGAMLTRKQISIRIERLMQGSRVSRCAVVSGGAVVALTVCALVAVSATATPFTTGVRSASSTQSAAAAAPRSVVDGCIGCNWQDADLHGRDFHDVTFLGANMQDADLRGANLRGAVLNGVNLQNADLDGADLRDARFRGANLRGASMNGALTDGATFIGTVLP